MKKKKRFVTLIEIMIVILLIGIIGGALAFNMRGSLDHGRKFKTEQNAKRVHDILEMEYAKGLKPGSEIAADWEKLVCESPLANGSKTIVDAQGKKFTVAFDNDQFIVK